MVEDVSGAVSLDHCTVVAEHTVALGKDLSRPVPTANLAAAQLHSKPRFVRGLAIRNTRLLHRKDRRNVL